MTPTGKYVTGIATGIACLAITQLVWSAAPIHQLAAGGIGLAGVVLMATSFWNYTTDRVGSIVREKIVMPISVASYFVIWTTLGRAKPVAIDALTRSVAEFREQQGRVEEVFNRLISERRQN